VLDGFSRPGEPVAATDAPAPSSSGFAVDEMLPIPAPRERLARLLERGAPK
jgi:hypothetical protein